MEELIKRIIEKYENLILELETINNENKSYVDIANKSLEESDLLNWGRLASDNLRRLNMAKAERDFLKENYIKDK